MVSFPNGFDWERGHPDRIIPCEARKIEIHFTNQSFENNR